MNDAWKPFTPPGPFPKWPSWRYGPNGESAIFDNEEDVPAGWADHPSRALEISELVAPVFAETAPNIVLTPKADIPRKPLTLKRREQPAE
jgi:hypothetical protein